jgi:hypothetical protein
MDTTRLSEEAAKRGVIEAALPDVVARARAHFGDTEPSQGEVDVWLTGLKPSAPHFWARPEPPASTSPEMPSWFSAEEKLTRHRQSQPVVVRAKPQAVVASPEQLKEWAGLSAIELLTQADALQAEQGS